MEYTYALSLFGKNLSAGLYRHDVEPLVMERPEMVSNTDEVALSSKIAVMGMNAFTKTESNEVVFALPLYYDFHDKLKIKAALCENGVNLKRFIPNTAAVAMYYATMCKDDKIVLVVINDGIGFSIGMYEIGDGLVEALTQTYFKHNHNVIDWRYLSMKCKATRFFYIGEQDEIGTRVCKKIASLMDKVAPDMESSIKMGEFPEFCPSSWITFGASDYAELLNGGLDRYLFLESMSSPLCMLSEKTYMCEIIEKDRTLPTKTSVDITTTHDLQTMMFIELFLRNPNEKCGLKQKDEQPILSYWIQGIEEGGKGEIKVEMIVDVDVDHTIKVIFRDKETNRVIEPVSHQHMFRLVSHMSKEKLEEYRPALHYEKDEN